MGNKGILKDALRLSYIIVFILLASGTAKSQPVLQLDQLATGFAQPVDLASAGDDRLFIVEQRGMIQIVDLEGNVNPTPFLDIRASVNDGGNEQGLLGLAFPPDFATSQVFYVNYTGGSGSGFTRVSRFAVSGADPDVADPDSEEILLVFNQPFSNHNGGDLNFGPDGHLYIATGDGGSANDPAGNAQNVNVLLGKILRIEVGSAGDYTIPADNPFVGLANHQEEIWSYGLRNPWRFSFDRETGDMWIGDVGQNAWEEVDFEPAGSPGGVNFGWDCFEGTHDFEPSGCNDDYEDPVYEYGHNSGTGGFSITGGFRYRGSEMPHIYGDYIFCDYVTGNFWVTSVSDADGSWQTFRQGGVGGNISTFGEDLNGEIYAGQRSTGTIYKLTAACSGSVAVTITEAGDSLVADRTTGQFQWTKDGSPIDGANTYYYVPEEEGDYAVEVIVNDMGCIYDAVSNTVTVMDPVSAVFDEVRTLRVYPNPVQDMLRVSLGQIAPSDIRSWQLTNVQGAEFRVRSYFNDGALMLDTRSLPRGYYYLRMQTGNDSHVGRFLVR